jgi:hypothetical protein
VISSISRAFITWWSSGSCGVPDACGVVIAYLPADMRAVSAPKFQSGRSDGITGDGCQTPAPPM